MIWLAVKRDVLIDKSCDLSHKSLYLKSRLVFLGGITNGVVAENYPMRKLAVRVPYLLFSCAGIGNACVPRNSQTNPYQTKSETIFILLPIKARGLGGYYYGNRYDFRTSGRISLN